MSKAEIAGLMVAAMLGLIALRVPVAAAMFVTGAVGYGVMLGEATLLNYLKGLLWARFSVYDLSVIPLFLLMGQFASSAGFSKQLFEAASVLVGHRKGGVAMSAIVACALFGAICGSSVATAATMSQVALPEMRRLHYSDRLATGTLAVGGTLGILIPPSVTLIIYAVLAEQSIVKLFAAALIPGLVAALGYCLVIAIYVRLFPGHCGSQARVPSSVQRQAVARAWPIVAVFTLMLVGIYGGFFTPAEGAAVGTIATMLLGVVRGGLTWRSILAAFPLVAQASAMIFMVLLGAAMLNSALAISQVPAVVAVWAQGLEASPILIVAGFLLCFVLLTTVLDELAMMLLLLPIVLPIILGFDLFGLALEEKAIWFGIMMLTVTSFGLIAPPIGLNVYVVSSLARSVPIREIYLGILPFLLSDVARVVVLFAVPGLSLWLVTYVK